MMRGIYSMPTNQPTPTLFFLESTVSPTTEAEATTPNYHCWKEKNRRKTKE